jgi:hypothetical protein
MTPSNCIILARFSLLFLLLGSLFGGKGYDGGILNIAANTASASVENKARSDLIELYPRAIATPALQLRGSPKVRRWISVYFL